MLKLQYSDHLMCRANSLEKSPMPGKTECVSRNGDRGRDGWMTPPTQWM